MNCVDQMEAPIAAALQQLWRKYPLLQVENGPAASGLSLRIAYPAHAEHGSNGAFLRALASQRRLGHLLASYLAAHGIAAGVDDDGAAVWIAPQQCSVPAARSALLAALDAMCGMLAAMRTDLLLEHRVATGRRRHQPYLDAGIAGAPTAASATIVVLSDAADADGLLAQDASLVTLDSAELTAAATLLRAWLPACELAPWTLQAGHTGVRIVPIWLPRPATALPAAALRAAQAHGSAHIAAAMPDAPAGCWRRPPGWRWTRPLPPAPATRWWCWAAARPTAAGWPGFPATCARGRTACAAPCWCCCQAPGRSPRWRGAASCSTCLASAAAWRRRRGRC